MEPIQALKPGSYLRHNTYRIEKVLGQGGFGITYLAYDLSLEKYMAIKEFFPNDYCDRDEGSSNVTLGTQGSKEFVNRLKAKFLKEARHIARFDHPNIIRIHAAFEENDTAYYVMDYIEGLTLAEIVRNNGPMPVTKALTYIHQVGNALEYVHDHNMTHLDVKPANIILRSTDEAPILIDFGLAKEYDAKGNQTSTTPIGISHGYAPMEQYADGGIRSFSPQTDLYSLAATLYYILSGIVPPQATKLIEEELIFPQNIPTKLIAPISKAMSASRKNRHEAIGQFMEDIEQSEIQDAAAYENKHKDHDESLADTGLSVGFETGNPIDATTNDSLVSPSDTEYTVSEEYPVRNNKGIPVWILSVVIPLAVVACICFFFIQRHGDSSLSGESIQPLIRQSFEEALLLLESEDSEAVKEGFERMRGLAENYDSARVEVGITFFPYLNAKTRQDSLLNPILKRRMHLNLNATTDADSVIKYLGAVSNRPPEASYILGCTYYQHEEDEKKALEMFQQAKESLYNGKKPGHGYDRSELGKILIHNISTLSK